MNDGAEQEKKALLSRIADLEQERSEHRDLACSLQCRLTLSRLITLMSAEFIASPRDQVDLAIQRALHLLGEYSGADRSYFVVFAEEDDHRVDYLGEWFSDESRALSEKESHVLLGSASVLRARVKAGETLFIQGREALSSLVREEREELESQGIRSIFCVPIVLKSPGIGFVGLDSASEEHFWRDDLSEVLKLAGLVFTNALESKRDEERRLMLESKMQHIQRLESLGVLAGGIAHDFNNILGCIIGNASMAMEDLDPSSSGYECVQAIDRAAEKAAVLTDQMLAYSGKGILNTESVDLSKLVEEMKELLQMLASKNATLSYNLLPGLPCVEADSSQFRQVLVNLVGNAAEALGQARGRITISTGVRHINELELKKETAREIAPGEYLFLEVCDTGCGMDEDTLSKIFDPFFSTKFVGRGLGLSATRGIVDSHRGRILVSSEEGHGSTFTVLLPPLDKVEANRTEQCAESITAEGAVLVVDDEEMVLNLATRILERMGFSVLSAKNGAEAIEVFSEQKDAIELVLLDLNMPELDGREALSELRKLRSDVRVILTSGYNLGDLTDFVQQDALIEFIKKPYRARDLSAAIKELLE